MVGVKRTTANGKITAYKTVSRQHYEQEAIISLTLRDKRRYVERVCTLYTLIRVSNAPTLYTTLQINLVNDHTYVLLLL